MQTVYLTSIISFAKIAWRNVIKNWRHSLATICAIAFGFTAISLFDGFLKEVDFRQVDGFTKRGMLGDIIIQHKNAQEKIDLDLWRYSMDSNEQKVVKDFIATSPNVQAFTRFLHVSGMINSGSRNAIFIGFGFDVKEGNSMRGEEWSWNTVAGKPLHLSDPSSILLGTGLGLYLNCQATSDKKIMTRSGNYIPEDRPFQCDNSRVTLSGTTESAQINTIDLGVAGLIDGGFREINKRMVHLPLEAAQKLTDTDKITMMTVKLKKANLVDQFVSDLRAYAVTKNIELDIVPWREHKISSLVNNTTQLLNVFRNLFMSVVVIIAIMSITNTMIKSVNERVREIGTLRSLGFRANELMLLFGFEGLFVSIIACSAGLSITVLISLLVKAMGLTYQAGLLSMPVPLLVKMAPTAWGFSALILSSLAMTTSVLAARRACKSKIAEALRYV